MTERHSIKETLLSEYTPQVYVRSITQIRKISILERYSEEINKLERKNTLKGKNIVSILSGSIRRRK